MGDSPSEQAADAAGVRRPRMLRWAVAILAALVVIAVLAVWPRGPCPIRETTLERSKYLQWMGPGAWRNLPFHLSAQDEADVIACVALALKVRHRVNDRRLFDDESVLRELEDISDRRPDFFYAEYLLGEWHAANGDAELARLYTEATLEHAPVVLVQTYSFDDGRPLAGGRIQTIEVECNRVQNGSLDPSLKLVFGDLTTDAEGKVRLPVYDTVYRMSAQAWPTGYDAEFPRLGWFESPSHEGLLPVVRVRAKE